MVNKKKKIRLTIYGLIAALLVLTATSFALWQTTRKQTNFNAIVSACLNLTINNESPEITMDHAYPVTDLEGLSTSGYSFTVTNTCDQPVSYAISIESVNDNSGKPFIGNGYIDISLDGKSPVKYSALDTVTSDSSANYTIRETRSLSVRQVGANSSRTHVIRMWLDEDTPMTEQNKTFVSKVTLTGGQGIDAACYSVNSSGVLYDYDTECGTAAVIPATVGNKQVKVINSNAFKGEKEVPEYIYHDGIKEPDKGENDIVSGPSEFGYLETCSNISNGYDCEIDYSIAYSNRFYRLLTDENEMGRVMQENNLSTEEELINYIATNYSPNELYGIIYYTGSDTAKLTAIQENIDNSIGEIYGMAGWTATKYYTSGSEPNPENIGMEEYHSMYYVSSGKDAGWHKYGYDIGTKESTGNTIKEIGLSITSLDLSQATNLEKIESNAFGTLPTPSSTQEILGISSAPTGLTSLTFGSNSNAIELGGAAFAGAKLNNLTIYNSLEYMEASSANSVLKTDNDFAALENKNDAYYIFGAFPGGVINNLTINKTGNNNSFSGYLCEGCVTVGNSSIDLNISLLGGATFSTTIGTLTISDGITNIGDGAFVYSPITTINFPSYVENIGDWAFWSYDGASLTLPNGLVTIGEQAFRQYQGSGQTLTIPSTVTSIGKEAFYRFNGSALVLNEGLQTLNNGAFNLYNGSAFTIPSTIQTLGTNNGSVFAFFEGTANINMTEANFNANVNYSPYWNSRGTNHFLSN